MMKNRRKKKKRMQRATFLLAISALAIVLVFVGKAAAQTIKSQRASAHLVAAIPFQNVPQKDIKMVQEEVNKITKKELGVTVEFAALDAYDNQVNLMLSGGEQLDVMAVFNEGLMENYVNDRLLPLDNYLEKYGQGIIREVGKNVIHCCDINHSLYGIPNNRDYASESNSYMMRKDILDKYGISPKDIQTEDDLERVFAIVKEKEPEMTVLLPGYGTILSNQYYLMGYFRPGAHMDYGRDEKLVNVFETEEYKEALKRVRRWYLRGYLEKDVLGSVQPLLKRVENGEVFAYTTKGKPNILSQDDLSGGTEMVCIRLGEAAISYNAIADFCYVIPRNTASPEKAMELLNLFYTNADIMNLLCYGVEGIHYKKMEDGHITFVRKGENNPFLNNAWSKPNQYITYVWEGNSLNCWEELKEFNRNAIQACDVGFNFDISQVQTEYTVLKEIYDEYKLILENGLVNPEEGLEKMLNEMEKNGLDTVLTVADKQFTQWKKRKIKVFP